jgi:hypothetical protein
MPWKPPYATLAQMRDWLRIRDAADVEDDDLITLALSASSRAVDKATGRQFGKADSPQTRTYPLRWSRTEGAHVADIDDLMDLTGLTFSTDDGTTTLDTDHYKLRPRNAIADGMVYTYVVVTSSIRGCACGFGPGAGFGFGSGFGFGPWCRRELTMTGLPGWNTFPDPVVEATLLQTSRLSVRRDSPYGVAGSPSDGSELRLLERLDPDIAPIIGSYVRTGWTAR